MSGSTSESSRSRHRKSQRQNRASTWCRDRLDSDVLPLTQEFLAHMLGSQRSTVSLAAGRLERSGLIDYSRGRLTILDVAAVQARACECYATLRQRELEFGIDPRSVH